LRQEPITRVPDNDHNAFGFVDGKFVRYSTTKTQHTHKLEVANFNVPSHNLSLAKPKQSK